MLVESLYVGLQKALQTNSQNNLWTDLNLLGVPPSGDGVFAFGKALSGDYRGNYTANRLYLSPFGQGGPGNQFSMRVYGWEEAAQGDAPGTLTYLPYLIVELLCTTCTRNGPVDSALTPRLVSENDYLCDTISFVQGNLGYSLMGPGYINSTGPGTNLIAFAFVDATAPAYIQFDFLQADPVGMNCLWAKAS